MARIEFDMFHFVVIGAVYCMQLISKSRMRWRIQSKGLFSSI